MKKYNYTESEQAAIVEARKGNRKELAKVVNKIRKQCIAENRFTEVEDTRSAKPKAKVAKKLKAKEEPAAEEETAVEVHGASETSVIIK